MPTLRQIYDFQIMDRFTGKAVAASGGTCLVVSAGGASKATLYNPDSDMVALANPISLNRGRGRFAVVAGTPETLDLYIMAPGGQFIVALALGPQAGRVNPIWIDTQRREQMLVMPVSYVDAGLGTTEYDTGFDFVTNAVVRPEGLGFRILAADAGELIDVGILSSESGGDADGFIAQQDTGGTAGVFSEPGFTISTSWPSANRVGALLSAFTAGTATDDRGSLLYKGWVCNGVAKSLTYTPTSWVTMTGFLYIPYTLYGH